MTCLKEVLLEKVVQALSSQYLTNPSGTESTVSFHLCSSAWPPSWFKKQTNKKKTHNILYIYLEFPQFTSSHKQPPFEVRHCDGRWIEFTLPSFRSNICLNFLFSINSVFQENFPSTILRSSFYCLIKVAFPLLKARLNSKSCPTHGSERTEGSKHY